MANRKIAQTVRGQRAVDGAGVRLVRVLGGRNVTDFDPFLMLDSFDSTDPNDYIAGFPTHPHRGIETITYLIEGRIDHEDSMGNRDTIHAGESQWMTAGSGILHQEMPKASARMLGFQLWLNLARDEKMTEPKYLSITRDMMPLVEQGGAQVRILSGSFGGVSGIKPNHIPATILDVLIPAGGAITVPTAPGETAFVFLIEGDAVVGGEDIAEKTAALLSDGDAVDLAATADAASRIIVFMGAPLREPIAWGGPIVMNTRAELEAAFDELDRGTFIRHD
ncbi:MAG: pirin family protein [Christensenellales bacterium]|jgi:redox-sensitive bicupin YhaK (pirin superfamily)